MSDSKAGVDPPGVDIADVIARNPQVDGDQLREAERLLGELQKRGISPATYGITSPYKRPSRNRQNKPRSGRHFA